MSYSPWIFTPIEGVPQDFLDNFTIECVIGEYPTHIAYLNTDNSSKLHEFHFNEVELEEYSKEETLKFLNFKAFRIELFKHKVLNL